MIRILSNVTACFLFCFAFIADAHSQDFFEKCAKECLEMNQTFSYEGRSFVLPMPNKGKAHVCFGENGLNILFDDFSGVRPTVELLTLFPTPIPVQTIYGGAIFEGGEVVDYKRIATSHWGGVNINNNEDTARFLRSSWRYQLVEFLVGGAIDENITDQRTRVTEDSGEPLAIAIPGPTVPVPKVTVTIHLGKNEDGYSDTRKKCIAQHVYLINKTKSTNCYKVRKKRGSDGKLQKPPGWEKFARAWKQCIRRIYDYPDVGDVISHVPDMCLGGHPGQGGCFLSVPSGCNTSINGPCSAAQPADCTMWNCIKAVYKDGSPLNVDDVLTASDKQEVDQMIQQQKQMWDNAMCDPNFESCRKKMKRVLDCLEENDDEFLPPVTILKQVVEDPL